MKTNFLSRAVAVTCSLLMMTGCGDIVVKVEKKPKNVDLSALENFSALNLQNSEDFLKHLDNLKVVAVDMLMKELASRDYRSEVRTAIRSYRSFLIQRAKGGVKIDDSFYSNADECRSAGLDFNMDQANGFLGIILKTAVLAKLSEVNAPKLNPGISKEVAAIGQLILMELGLKVEGTVEVEDVDGMTKTTGSMRLSLSEIADEGIDAATKRADQVEVLTMTFTRALGENYTGTFDALIEIDHEKAPESIETLQAKMGVERKAQEANFLHTVAFELGVKDGATAYARQMTFEQVQGEQKKVKITDTLAPGTEAEKAYVSVIDVEAGTQCKVGGSSGGGADGKGDEGGFIDGQGDGTGSDDSDDGSTDDATDGGDGSTDGSTDGGDGDDGKGDGGKGDDDDDPKGDDGSDGSTLPNNPGQTPGQSPGQTPGQAI